MPCIPPHPVCPGTPHRMMLAAGTRLYRVHQQTDSAVEFSSRFAQSLYGGGRFDPVPGNRYPYLYAAFSGQTALAEVMLRDLPFNDRGRRILPAAKIKGRQFSCVELTAGVTLLALTTSKALAAIGQDEWLVHAEPPSYPQTRDWAHWLRRQAPWAQGLVWPSKRDVGENAMILFGDRCGQGALRLCGQPAIVLDGCPGRTWLNDMLAAYEVTIRKPVTCAG